MGKPVSVKHPQNSFTLIWNKPTVHVSNSGYTESESVKSLEMHISPMKEGSIITLQTPNFIPTPSPRGGRNRGEKYLNSIMRSTVNFGQFCDI